MSNPEAKTRLFDTPILLLIFNRPATTQKVMEVIRQIRPKYLYIAADGPRNNEEKDNVKCEQTRNVALKNVDWDCEVKTLFRKENLGCGKGPASAITWFFENVEAGIILEDDILPSVSFFDFCKDLLIKYKDDHTVMSIGGTNFLNSTADYKASYLFSNYSGNWGWASWSRAWKGYDYNISSWERPVTQLFFKKKFSEPQFLFFKQIFDSVCNKNVDDIWDYQWWFHRLVNNANDITPKVNLTKNIGFNIDASHTFNVSDDIKEMKLHELAFPLTHPSKLTIDKAYDSELANIYYTIKYNVKEKLFSRVLNKLLYK